MLHPNISTNVTRVDACARACTLNNLASLNVFPVKVASGIDCIGVINEEAGAAVRILQVVKKVARAFALLTWTLKGAYC